MTKLRVWWIPQVPGKSFFVDVSSLEEGVKVTKILAEYDLFQFKNKIKPDYSNAGGILQWDEDSDGEGNPGWIDWYDEESGEVDPETYLAEKGISV
jgi:Superinfection exclusion gene product 17